VRTSTSPDIDAPDPFAFSVGRLRCTVLFDSILRPLADQVFPAEHEARWPDLSLGADRRIRTPVFCLLIEREGQLILIDGGNGERPDLPEEGQGRLVDGLATLGVRASDVDIVVMTHAHLDHVGGLVTTRAGQREVTFGKARHILPRADWDWVDSPREDLPAPVAARAARAHGVLSLLRTAAQLELVEPAADVAPGVRIIGAPGHSPGNSIVVAESDGATLVFVGDTFHHPGQIDDPELVSPNDHDARLVPASRMAVIRFARDRRAIVAASHFAYPSVGALAPDGSRPAYLPMARSAQPI
jgi:glyoxylase-like metal-dependent hydrolase (beta-lactamase superfamily II)